MTAVVSSDSFTAVARMYLLPDSLFSNLFEKPHFIQLLTKGHSDCALLPDN